MTAKSVFNSALPFLNFLKILGIFPMTLSVFKNYEIKTTGVIATIGASIVYVVVLIFQLTNLNTLKSSSKILRNVWNIVSVNALIVLAFMVIYQLCKIKTVASIINTINDVDLKVNYDYFES